MKYSFFIIFFVLTYFLIFNVNSQKVPDTFKIGLLWAETGIFSFSGENYTTAARVAIDQVNKNPNILPNTKLEVETFDTQSTVIGVMNAMIDAKASGCHGIIGPDYSFMGQPCAILAQIFNLTIISISDSSTLQGNKKLYPYYTRIVPPDNKQAQALVDLALYFEWYNISMISNTESYGISLSTAFRQVSSRTPITIESYQQFAPNTKNLTSQVRELNDSNTHTFVAFVYSANLHIVLEEAARIGLVGPRNVWLGPEDLTYSAQFINGETGLVEYEWRKNARGFLGTTFYTPLGEEYQNAIKILQQYDPNDYIKNQPEYFSLYCQLIWDCVTTLSIALNNLIIDGNNFDNPTLTSYIRKVNFTGITGPVYFGADGERIGAYNIMNLQKDSDEFKIVGYWKENEGITLFEVPEFYDGRKVAPDLDVRPPRTYWSCHEKKKLIDLSGKNVSIEVPGGNDPNNIDSDYICDEFIDCDNLSDENDCSPSYVGAFIGFGIVTPFFVFIAIGMLIFVIVGGFLGSKRILRSNFLYLIYICLCSILGLLSTFAWYGRPTTAGCILELYLFGLACILIIPPMYTKSFRLWRLFRSKRKLEILPYKKFILITTYTTIPAIILLLIWTLLAVPIADLQTTHSKEHYVCTQSGLVGSPVGYVFFFLEVAYLGALAILACLYSLVLWSMPSYYHESKILCVALLNATFLCAVLIPVFFVVRGVSPVSAWIVRTVATIYGFSSTLWIHIAPIIFGIIKDTIKDIKELNNKKEETEDNLVEEASKSASTSDSGY